MISGNDLSDVGKGHIRHGSNGVYRDMAGVGDLLRPLTTDDILSLDVILFLHGGEDLIYGDGHGLSPVPQLGNAASGQLHGDVAACEEALGGRHRR